MSAIQERDYLRERVNDLEVILRQIWNEAEEGDSIEACIVIKRLCRLALNSEAGK